MPNDAGREAVCRRVAALLREARERQGLSMTAVAERAGLSQQMVSYVERGMRKPTLDTLIRVAEALELDLVEVLARAMRT
jgi:transcriptional regulator with XRE-family HTH domain